MLPDSLLHGPWRTFHDLTVESLHLHGGLAQALVGLTPEKFADGSFRSGYSALEERAQAPVRVISYHQHLDVGLGELLPVLDEIDRLLRAGEHP